jgi:hypothetical protein
MSTTGAPSTVTDSLTARSIVEATGTDLDQRLRNARVLDEASGLLTGAGSSLWEAAYGELAQLAQEFLSVDIARVMIDGWCKYQKLIDAGASTRGTGERAVVELAGRDLSLTQHPSVDVMLGKVRLTKVSFELRVDVKVTALSGIVRNGALVELTTGTCTVIVAFNFGSTALAKGKRSIDPHVAVSLGNGVPLTSVPAQRSRETGHSRRHRRDHV